MVSQEILERRLVREQNARQQAEAILEEKSWQLYQANEQLRLLNENLAQQVKAKVEELQQSEERYRQLIESVQDIIYKISPDGFFTFVNPVVEQSLGYTESEFIGQHFVNIILPAYRESVTDVYHRMLVTQQPSAYNEFPVRSKDGRTVWLGQTVRLITNGEEVQEFVVVARDITQRKATEDAFRATQARMTSLITNLQTGVLVEDENRKVILANQLYCDLFGITVPPESLVGSDYWQQAAPAKSLFMNAGSFLHRMKEVVLQQQPVVDEVISLVDGRILEWDYIPIFLGGHYRGHLWQYTDITEKYRSDERIRKSEEKYRGIMNSMELGLLEVDNDQVIRKAYDRFCEMVGYTSEELIGKRAHDLLIPQEFSKTLAVQQRQRAEGVASSYELQMVKKDGERIWVLVSDAPIVDERGEVVGSMGIHYEITERKRLEQELAKAKQIAEDARHTEKQFLANMSHEIRTPLNAILGFSNLLESTTLDTEQVEFVNFIRTAGKNLLTIVNDILDISKIEAGMLPLESIPFSISSLVDSIRTMLHPVAFDKNLWLRVDMDSTLPHVVLGDPTRLTQILLNLLSNAIKFTKSGGVTVQVKGQETTEDAVRVRFTIQDTGIGMEPSILPHIFERFRQASDFTTRYYGGTGLGLNIVKSLTEMQGGWVTVNSAVGEGSCFTLEITYKIAPADVDQAVDLDVAVSKPNGGKVNILVVEDNPMNQKLALQVLKRLGYTAQVAENGQQALEVLGMDNVDIDLVLMDIQMPVMDGYTTTRHIRNTLHSRVPIIAMTAHALANEREQCLQAGMNDFLPKPFQVEELQRVMRKYMPSARYEAMPEKAPKPQLGPVPGFSLETLLSAVGDDLEFAGEMLEMFLLQTPDEVEQLRQSQEFGDVAAIGRLVHSQKGPVKTLGMVEASQLILGIEAAIAAKKGIVEISPLLDQYLRVLEVELVHIQAILQDKFNWSPQ